MEGRHSRQLVLGAYLWLLALIGVGGGAQFFAWVPALLGEFADRVLFFNTIVPVTFRGRYL
jgi:hypothetical protein